MFKPIFALCVLCLLPFLLSGCFLDSKHSNYKIELVDFDVPRTTDGKGEYFSSELFGVEKRIRYTGKSPITLSGFALEDQFTCDFNGVRMVTSGPTDYGAGYIVNPGEYVLLGNSLYSNAGSTLDVVNQTGIYHFEFKTKFGKKILDVVVLSSASN